MPYNIIHMESLGHIFSEIDALSESQKIDILYRITQTLAQKKDQTIQIPLGIFSCGNLSALEAIAKYLHETKKMRFAKIARILCRSSKTIWTSYQKARRKMPTQLPQPSDEMCIPLTIFSDARYTILEGVILYLKEQGMPNNEIARRIKRSQSTVWITYERIKKKAHV